MSLNALSNLVPPAIGLLSAPVLARGLGVAERGDVAGVVVNLVIAATALTLGLPEALTYFVGRDGAVAIRRILRASAMLVGVGAAAAVCLWLSADAVGYSDGARPALLVVGCALPVVLVLSAVRGLAAGEQLWRRIAVERLLTSVSRLVAFLVLWGAGALTVTTAVATIAISTMLGLVCYLPLIGRTLRHKRSPSVAQNLASFGLRYWPGSLAGALLVRIDQLLMVPLSTSEQLGLYVTAITLFEAASFASNALRDVIFSVESHSPNLDRVAQAARLAGLVTLGVASLLAVISVPLVPLLFGSDFSGAVPVLMILLPAGVLGASSSIAAAALSGWGKAGWRSFGLVLSLAVKVIALIVLVPAWGAAGAAWATLIGTVVVWIVIAAAMWRTESVTPRALLVPTGRDLASLRGLARRSPS